MTLNDLKIGMSCTIESVDGEESLRHHLLDMGLIPGTTVTLKKTAPMGDPMELRLRGYELTLRKSNAEQIEIKDVFKDKQLKQEKLSKAHQDAPHPRVGENGYRHQHRHRNNRPLPENRKLTFALIGNQNCGKTTLFNQLTGSNQHVGNFPGVTVDRKDGVIRNYPNTVVTDLPGIYSLSPYSSEELITREFLIKDHPDAIINIIDATNIERNMYLTMQLIELNIPMVLALNMMDEVRQNGGTILINELEAALGIPVIPISAAKNEGIDELAAHAVEVARYRERPARMDFCDSNGSIKQQAVHRCIHSLVHLIEDHAHNINITPRFVATKLVEGDNITLDALSLDENEKEMITHIRTQLQEESGIAPIAALADMRYDFIEKLCSETVVKPHESREHMRSSKIDKVLTGKYTAIPTFLGIMALMFFLTFGVLGPLLSSLLNLGIVALTNLVDIGLTNFGINPVIHSLVIDGIFAGVGSVLGFLPIIVVLFFFLSIMEDSGYMARIAFVMDKPLRKIGLSGRSFVPMLIGFGCSVPAIMATRTLSSERDRRMTIFLIPFMSCSAKLPIYAFITMMFFPSHHTLIIFSLYIMGLIAGILYAKIINKTSFSGQPIPFVMELPNYRMPSPKSVAHLIWDKAKDFITKAFTIIFWASIVVWFLQTFDYHFNVVTDSQDSLLAILGNFISPIFKPLGFNDWRVSTALITGFIAKESVVSTLTVLLGGNTALLSSLFTPFTAFVFLVFTLYYTPCVAAIAAVHREMHTRMTAFKMVIVQCVVAWLLAYIVHCIGIMFGIA